MTGVTVIICCYNSSSRIEETLRHLAVQQIKDNLKWEVIVVDNASTDDTREAAINIWSKINKQNIELTAIQQPIPGLANARQKGIETARYDVVIFCDDDNRLHKHYVQSAFELLHNDEIAIACGYGIATTINSFPDWFQYFFTFYACHSIDENPIVCKQPDDLQYGAGMVIRKSFLDLLTQNGYSYYLEDRSGSKLSSGQDTELILLAKILGKKVISTDKLKFFHFIPESRLSENYLYKLIHGVSFNGFKLEPFKIYLFSIKPLTNMTWFKDTLYVEKYLLRAVCKYILKSSFQNKIALLTNWHALKSSFSNYNKYKKVGRRLDTLKVNIAKSMNTKISLK
jgi:glycosyltransferase involved in cell wall biosynthesis